MYLISYEKDSFYIEPIFDEFVDKDQFDETITYLQQLGIVFDFNKNHGKYKISNERIDEIIMWMSRDQKEYEISNACADQLIILREQYNKTEIKFFRNRKFDKSILNEGVECINDQEDDINWSLSRSVYLDSHAPGCGKTFINICVFSTLYKKGLVDGIIIVVPLGMSLHWVYQILEFVNVFKSEDIQIIDNLLKIKPFEKFTDKKILIVRQDLYADTIASYNKGYAPKKSLKNMRWKTADYVDIKKMWEKENIFFLVDEAHSIKNIEAIKTKAIFSTKKYYANKTLLTATPSINGIEDMYSLMTFLDRSVIPMSNGAFKLWLAKNIGNRFDKYAIIDYNTENVQKFMATYQHLFIQKELKTNYKLLDKKIECDITKIQRRLYEIVVEKELSILHEEYDQITWKLLLSKIHLLLEVFDNPLLLKKRHYDDEEINDLLDKWKIENDPKFIFLKNRLEDLIEEQNRKVIVYDIHPLTLNMLAEKFEKYHPLVIHGELKVKDKEKDRKEKENLFNYNDKHKLMLLSAYTSSAGINLQKGGNNIIYHTLSWDALHLEQGGKRTHRITSDQDSLIELPYYPNTIDQLRLRKNFNRIEFNGMMGQVVEEKDLQRLLNGTL